MSLRDFANKCGIAHTTIDNIEKGFDFRTGKAPKVKLITLQKIADACGVPLSYITQESKPESLDEQLKTAVFGIGVEVTDDMWNKLLEYAEFLKFQNNKL